VTDLPIALTGRLAERLGRALDREAKISRALESLGPIAGRDVLLLDDSSVWTAERLAESGAQVTSMTADRLIEEDLEEVDPRVADGSADVLVVAWSAFRHPTPTELAAAERLLRPGGRLLVIHDYGRDDVSRLLGPRPEYTDWSRRDGPFLGNGFRVRVIHSWWTFDSLDETREFLADAFGATGEELGAGLTRPRLSYNVAVYHRSFDAA
jgi:hypothetical protein